MVAPAIFFAWAYRHTENPANLGVSELRVVCASAGLLLCDSKDVDHKHAVERREHSMSQ